MRTACAIENENPPSGSGGTIRGNLRDVSQLSVKFFMFVLCVFQLEHHLFMASIDSPGHTGSLGNLISFWVAIISFNVRFP